MARKRTHKDSDKAILARVKEEMAESRIAKSARNERMTLASPRIMTRKRGKAKPNRPSSLPLR
jgi:hypothetical protein